MSSPTNDAELNRQFPLEWLNKILPDILKLRTKAEKLDTHNFHSISKRSTGTVWQQIVLLINVFIKKLMKNVKNTNNFTPITDALLSD